MQSCVLLSCQDQELAKEVSSGFTVPVYLLSAADSEQACAYPMLTSSSLCQRFRPRVWETVLNKVYQVCCSR